MIIIDNGKKITEEHVIVTDSAFFEIFDFELIKGDINECLKSPNSLVLSETIATKYFNAQDPIGQQLIVDGLDNPAIVTGVMKDIPENSQIQADILLSMITYTAAPSERDEQWGNYGPSIFVLTAQGTNHKSLEAKFPEVFGGAYW